MSKKSALFIINPISGTRKYEKVIEKLKEYFADSDYNYDTIITQYRGHAVEISYKNKDKYNLIVAVGGDGTVNETAKGLAGSNCIMGIIPSGSGNGLARHLHLPVKLKDAIEVIKKSKTKFIDIATINNHHFVNVAGIGFDAHIAHLFANIKKRGPIPYIKLATQEFQQYKAKNYEIIIDNNRYNIKAFLVSFANSSQFGNNAYISPHAIINDGLIDVCMMSEFPVIEAGQLAIKLFNKRMDKSKYMNIVRGKHVIIKSENEEIKAHVDGEPIILPSEFDVNIFENNLQVICNTNKSIIEIINDKMSGLHTF
jgi:YegS/Rv2252/BmrU family lipid kinase